MSNIKFREIPLSLKRYSIFIMLTYSFLMTEYVRELSNIMICSGMIPVSYGIQTYIYVICVVVFLLFFAMWAVESFLFHVFSLLLGGKGNFGELLSTTGFLHVIPLFGTFISLMRLTNIDAVEYSLVTDYINQQVYINNVLMGIFYCAIAVTIYYIYHIKWYYSLISVFFPLGIIYGISQLVSLL